MFRHLLMNILLPFAFSIMVFVLGICIGKKKSLKKTGLVVFLAIAVVLAWGWSLVWAIGLPDPLKLLWWTSLIVAASGLPTGIAFASLRQKKWIACVPTAAFFIYMLFSFGLACVSARKPEVPTGPYFRVLTYNVNWGGPMPELAVKAIKDCDADIVCLQETNPQWEKLLRDSLAGEYPYMKFRRSGGAGGQGFLSRLPMKEIDYITEKAGWFPAWIVEVDTPAGTVQFMNVHLRPPLSERGGVSLSALSSTKDIRLQEVKDIHPRLDENVPAIIIGDFNENMSGSASRWLNKKGLKDALVEFDPYGKTWQWKTSFGTFSGSFDHIFYTPHLYCLEAGVVREGASDHFPVTAVFQSREKNSLKDDE